MKIKRLHLFMLRAYSGPFFVTFFITIFILLMQFVWKYVEDLVGKGLEWHVIVELMVYISAGLVPMALPLSVLLSALMTFGNMGEHNELLAMKAAGISLQRVMFPLIVVAFFISVGAFLFSNHVMPYTNLKAGSLLYDVTHQRPEMNLKPNAFNNDVQRYTIRISSKAPERNMLYDVMLYDHTRRKGNDNVTLADSAHMIVTNDKELMVLTLYNGHSYVEVTDRNRSSKRNRPHQRDEFEEKKVVVPLTGFKLNRTDEALFKRNYQMLNLKQLEFAIDSISETIRDKEKDFTNDMMTVKYFKSAVKDSANRDMVRKIQENPDTLTPDALPVKTYIDSFFQKLPQKRKMKILDEATQTARSIQHEISFKAEDHYRSVKHLRRYQIEFHRKFALSFACLVFFFIGAPLGAIIRKGGLGMPAVISVFFFVIYYVISLMGEKFARESIVHPFLGIWVSSLFFFPLGAFLTYKATTDSVIMNIDSYFDFFKKIFRKKKKAASPPPDQTPKHDENTHNNQ